MRKISFVIIAVISTLLFGCNPDGYHRHITDRMVPDDDKVFAHEYLDAVRSRDFDSAIRLLAPQLNQPGVESNLTMVAETLDEGEVVSQELVGCNIFTTPQKRRSTLTYQYEFTNTWVLATLIIDTEGDQQQVVGIRVNPLSKSLRELNAFTFEGKGLKHYVVLLVAILIFLFILYALISCIRTKFKKRKWLWILFIIFGLGSLKFNWTTGSLLFNPLSFSLQLFGAGIVKWGPYSPWIISLSFPLGAILFLARKNKLMKQPEEEESNNSPESISEIPAEEGSAPFEKPQH